MHAVYYGTRTDTGRARDANEDSFLVKAGPDSAGHLFLVADGVGGELFGTQASQLGAKTAHDSFYDSFYAALKAGDALPDAEGLCAMLRDAFLRANSAVYREAERRRAAKHMATTLVAVALTKVSACVAWVGDSRLYHLAEGKPLKQITRDHSYINLQIEQGLISEKEAITYPGRNVLARSIGGKPEVEVDTIPLSFSAGDMALLCSDGLTHHVSDREIEHLLRFSQDAPSAANQLVDLANQRGGKDNITVIVLDFGKAPTSENAFETDTLSKRPDGLDGALLYTPSNESAPPPRADHRARWLLLALIVVALILGALVIVSVR